MATYDETVAGGGKVAGCATITYIKVYTTLYAAGDIVFNVDKARRGVLEKVVIKKQKVINSAKTGGQFKVMYVDTLNALWNEWDLVSHAQAIEVAKTYYENLLADAESLSKC
jgi:hypothetical protein